MKKPSAIAALATLMLVGPVLGQLEDKERNQASGSDPLEVLAKKAALRLAGFEPQEGEDDTATDSTDVAKPKLRVYFDEETGMLMVEGPPDEIARFERAYELVIEKMRQVGPAKPDIRKYKCRHIDVSLAAALLDDIFNGPQKARQRAAAQQRGRQQQQRGRQQQQRGRQPEPEPEPEEETGGMGRGMSMIETLFGGGDSKATDPTELMGIQVVPEKRTNYLFIMAKTDLFPQIIDTLYTVDVESLEEEKDSDIVVLQKLNADEVKSMLEDLLGITDARAAQQSDAARARRAAQQRRGGRGQQGQGAAELAAQLAQESMQIGVGGQEFKVSDIKISSLAATNTIIVFGPEEARKSIVKIIENLDEEGPDERAVDVPLEFADAAELATTLQKAYGTGGKDGAKNITIEANPSSNTIYITAPVNVREEIKKRIMVAESQAADTKTPRTIQILLGDAMAIASTLDTFFKERGRGKNKITIIGDDTSNTVIVRAPEPMFKEIAALAAEMDIAATPVVPKFYRLEHAYAPEVKEQVQDMVRQLVTSTNVTKGKMPDLGAFGVTADPATNSLIVMGTPMIFAVMDQVVAEVDSKPKDPTRRTTRTIPLAKNDAAEVARNITKLFAGGGKKREGVDPPSAEANVSTNAVVVAGTLKQIEEIEAFIKSLEDIATPPEGGELREYTIDLVHVDADQAAEVINSFFTQLNTAREAVGVRVKDTEKTVTVVPDMISGKLFVNATEENKGKIDQLLVGIDTQGAADVGARQTKVFQLKFSDPNNMVNAINQSFSTGRRVPEKEKVTAVAEWGTSSVIVTANERNLSRVEAIIDQVDIEGGQGKVVKIYEVKEARATELANTLNQTQQGRRRTRQGQMPTSIVADEATNVLVITTTPSEYEDLLPVIEQLDVEREADAGRYIEIYRIKYANLWSVWSAIDGAFNRGRGIKEEDRVSGSVDWETGTIIITANKDRHDQIETMLGEIDTETAGGRKIHMVKMEFGDADAVAQSLQQVINAEKVQRGQSRPTVTADAGTNTLIVYASESELASFQPVIEAMNVEDSAPGTPQRIELEHANAAQLADLLTQLFTDPAQQRGRGGRRGGGTQKIVPLILSDDASNTLIVRAQQLDFDQIKDMAAKLDIESDDGPSSTRIITVAQGTDVDSFGRNLERLIRQGERARRDQNRNYKPKNVSIMADPRTNSLIVSGAPSQFDEVERIAKALESIKPGGTANIRVVPLKNIRSNDVKKVLDNLIDQRNQSSRGRGRRR